MKSRTPNECATILASEKCFFATSYVACAYDILGGAGASHLRDPQERNKKSLSQSTTFQPYAGQTTAWAPRGSEVRPPARFSWRFFKDNLKRFFWFHKKRLETLNPWFGR